MGRPFRRKGGLAVESVQVSGPDIGVPRAGPAGIRSRMQGKRGSPEIVGLPCPAVNTPAGWLVLSSRSLTSLEKATAAPPQTRWRNCRRSLLCRRWPSAAFAPHKKTPPCRVPQSFEPAFAGGNLPSRSALPAGLPHSCPRDRFPLYRCWLKTPVRRSPAQQGYPYYTIFCPERKSPISPLSPSPPAPLLRDLRYWQK